MQYLNILYFTVPVSYLVWYNLATVHVQWDTLDVGDKPARMSRLWSRIGLLVLLTLALFACAMSEYSYVASGKPASTVVKCPALLQNETISKDSWEQFQLLACQTNIAVPFQLHRLPAMRIRTTSRYYLTLFITGLSASVVMMGFAVGCRDRVCFHKQSG